MPASVQRRLLVSLIPLTLSLLSGQVPALGQLALPTPDANWPFHGASDSSSPPTNAVFGNGWIFYAAGNLLYGRYASSGQLIAQPSQTGGNIEKAPALAQLGNGRWYVFVAADDGKLYKFDVAESINNPGMPLQIAITGGEIQIASLRRGSSLSCTTKDSLTATPTVQLAALSNASYSIGKDLVFVPTHYGCNETTTNKIYALDAADITQPPVWVMNDGGDYQIDYWDSCILDYGRNAIYCGTALPTAGVQNSIWGIGTVSGVPIWAANVGFVSSRPVIGQTDIQHLYVAATDSATRLHALDPATGNEAWAFGIGSPVLVTSDVSVGSGQFAGVVLTTDGEGAVNATIDNGANPAPLWRFLPSFGHKSITRAELFNPLGKAYVGLDDGTVHQINFSAGEDEGEVTVGDASSVSPFSLGLLLYQDLNSTKLVASRSGGSPATEQFFVPLASSATTINSTPNPALLAEPMTFTATVNGENVTPTGNVLFMEGANPIGSAALNGSGQATFGNFVKLNIGSYSITATYSGDSNFTGSTSPVLTQVVRSLQSIVVSPTTTSIPIGKTQQFIATATYSDGSTQDITTAVT